MKYRDKLQFKITKKSIAIIVGCIILNGMGKLLTSNISLPFWLDTIGTMLAGALLGPFGGGLVGFITNCTQVFLSPLNFYYGLINVAIGVYVGYFYPKDASDVFQIIYTASLLSIITICLCVPIDSFVRGGYTGNQWGDALVDMMRQKGSSKIVATISGAAFVDFPDKILSLVIANLCIYIPRKIKKQSMIVDSFGKGGQNEK